MTPQFINQKLLRRAAKVAATVLVIGVMGVAAQAVRADVTVVATRLISANPEPLNGVLHSVSWAHNVASRQIAGAYEPLYRAFFGDAYVNAYLLDAESNPILYSEPQSVEQAKSVSPSAAYSKRWTVFMSNATSLDAEDATYPGEAQRLRIMPAPIGQANPAAYFKNSNNDPTYRSFWNVFYRDRDPDVNGTLDESGTTTLISRPPDSVTPANAQANGDSIFPVTYQDSSNTALDGRFVVFQSSASNLLPAGVDSNGKIDIFLWDRDASGDKIVLVSAGDANEQGTLDSGNPTQFSSSLPGANFSEVYTPASIYTAGQTPFVVFQSEARWSIQGPSGANVAHPDGANSSMTLYLRTNDGVGGGRTMDLLQFWNRNAHADNDAWNPVVTSDGRYVAFKTTATNLIAGQTDTSGQAQVYLLYCPALAGDSRPYRLDACPVDLQAKLVTRNVNGQPATAQGVDTEWVRRAGNPSIAVAPAVPTSNQREAVLVAFDSYAADLLPDGQDSNNMRDVFIYRSILGGDGQLSADAVELVSTDPAGEAVEGVDVLGSSDPSLAYMDVFLTSDETGMQVTNNYDAWRIAYTSFGTNLVEGDANDVSDVFVRDRRYDRTWRASVSWNGLEVSPGGQSETPSISGDGMSVYYSSTATTMIERSDVYSLIPRQVYARQSYLNLEPSYGQVFVPGPGQTKRMLFSMYNSSDLKGFSHIKVLSVDIINQNPANAFTLLEGCSINNSQMENGLVPVNECLIEVFYSPTEAGSQATGTLHVVTDDEDFPVLDAQLVGATGGGVSNLSLSPSMALLQPDGSTMIDWQTFTLTNTGNASVRLGEIKVTRTVGSGSLYQSNNCPAQLGAGASCSITVTYQVQSLSQDAEGLLSIPQADSGQVLYAWIKGGANKVFLPILSR